MVRDRNLFGMNIQLIINIHPELSNELYILGQDTSIQGNDRCKGGFINDGRRGEFIICLHPDRSGPSRARNGCDITGHSPGGGCGRVLFRSHIVRTGEGRAALFLLVNTKDRRYYCNTYNYGLRTIIRLQKHSYLRRDVCCRSTLRNLKDIKFVSDSKSLFKFPVLCICFKML